MANQDVKLKVMAAGSPVPTGWTACQNNASYMYKYSGGNPSAGQPAGSFNFTHGGGTKTVDIKLKESSGFSISSVTISYDDSNKTKDLSTSQSGDTWTITDTDVDAESGYFNVFVNDGNVSPAVTNIECDPRWVNN